jgi:hypothetical protein
MIQRIWLTSFFTLAIAAALSSDATAADRHKQAHHAKKTHEASRHTAALGNQRHAIRRPASLSNGSSCDTPNPTRVSAVTQHSLPITRTGRALA